MSFLPENERRKQPQVDLPNEQKEIEKLIEKEDNPQVRLQLMIMNRINLSLIANTTTIHEIGDKLESHLLNYETHTKLQDELKNKGKGAWVIIAWVVGVLQLGGVYLWSDLQSKMLVNQKENNEHKVSCALNELRIKVLEDFVDTLRRK